MANKKAFLLLNGETPKKLPDLSNYEIICATDGAYNFLKTQNIKPDFISGDFDSLEEKPTDIKTIHTPNQDLTDFDKILQILYDKGCKEIDIYGASGKAQDHFLGNLHTALQWQKKLNLIFYDNYGYYFLAKHKTFITNCKDKIISLIPFYKTKGIVTKGLKYALKKEDLIFGDRIGTRNKATENNIEITFEDGNLIVFVND